MLQVWKCWTARGYSSARRVYVTTKLFLITQRYQPPLGGAEAAACMTQHTRYAGPDLGEHPDGKHEAVHGRHLPLGQAEVSGTLPGGIPVPLQSPLRLGGDGGQAPASGSAEDWTCRDTPSLCGSIQSGWQAVGSSRGRSPHRDAPGTQGNRIDCVNPRSPTLRFVWIAPSPLTARVDLPLPYCPILASSRIGMQLQGIRNEFGQKKWDKS